MHVKFHQSWTLQKSNMQIYCMTLWCLRSVRSIWNYLTSNVLQKDWKEMFSTSIWNLTFFPCPADEAGPGPVKSKYDALDFDTLLKEAQKSMHRWQHSAPDWPALVNCSNTPPTTRPLSTSMQGNLAKCLHFYRWNKVTIRTLFFFKFLSPEDTA